MNTKINNWFIDPESILNPKLHDKQNIDSSVLSYIDYLNEYIDFITDSELNRRLNYLYKYFMGYVNFTFTYENIFDKCNDSFGEQYGGSSTKYMILIDNKIPFPHHDLPHGLFIDLSRKNETKHHIEDYDLDNKKYYDGCGDGHGAGALSGANEYYGHEEW